MIRYRRDTVATPMGSVDRTILMSTMVLCLTLAVAAFAYIHQQQQNIQEVGERFDRLKNRVLGRWVCACGCMNMACRARAA